MLMPLGAAGLACIGWVMVPILLLLLLCPGVGAMEVRASS
jgi:hypothetical protein